LAQRARAAGVPVSFDPGRRCGDRDYAEALARADVVFLNDREAATMLADDPYGDPDRTIVLKHGPRGAEVRRGSTTHIHPGFAVESVDTTGAGDAFAAGFIAALLDGESDERALAVANACGALAARSTGARTVLRWDDVESLSSGE
jgi:ribokinase